MAIFYDKNKVTNIKILEKNVNFVAISCEIDNSNFVIVNTYLNSDFILSRIDILADFLNDITEESGGAVIVGGDFNSRLEKLGDLNPDLAAYTSFAEVRTSMDEAKVQTEGLKLVEVMDNLGFTILNGRSDSDKNGEFTFVGQGGTSLIDQFWVNTAALFSTIDLKVLNMGMSDHLPVRVTLNVYTNFREPAGYVGFTCMKWKEGIEEDFRNKLAQTELTNSEDTMLDYELLQDSLKLVARELDLIKEVHIGNKIQYRDKPWFDKTCKNLKREVNKSHRSWIKLKSESARQTYLKKRKNLY